MSGKTYEYLYGAEKAIEIRKKMSKSISATAIRTGFTKIAANQIGDFRRGKTFSEIFGVKKSSIMKSKITRTLHKFRQTPEGLLIRDETSRRNLRFIASGRQFCNTHKGDYKGVFFGSSLEKSFLILVDSICGSLNQIKRNTDIIPRKDIAGRRGTIPDYKVIDNNGKLLGFIEVKGNHLLETDRTYFNAIALKDYVDRSNILGGYFTYDTLKILNHLNGNPDPIWLNSILRYCQETLNQYIVNQTEQRLSVEDIEANNTLKIRNKEISNSNYLAPSLIGV